MSDPVRCANPQHTDAPMETSPGVYTCLAKGAPGTCRHQAGVVLGDNYTGTPEAAARIEYWRALDEDDDRPTLAEARADERGSRA